MDIFTSCYCFGRKLKSDTFLYPATSFFFKMKTSPIKITKPKVSDHPGLKNHLCGTDCFYRNLVFISW